MTTSPTNGQIAPEDVTVTLRGEMPLGVDEYAQKKVAHATRVSGRSVHGAAVVAQQTSNADPAQRYRVEATVNVAGTPVRAEAHGSRPHEATDQVVDLLRRRITALVDRWNQRSRWLGEQQPVAGEERRYADVPADERQIVRRKSFALEPLTPDEALFDMDMLGHDFLLFVDAGTQREALVHRRADGTSGVLGVDAEPARLDEGQARERLDVGGEPFVFFTDAASGRGHVLYRRFDGHYGLIEPTDG